MVRTNHVKVNKEAIREKVYNMNSTLVNMSRAIGRGDGWLPQLVRYGSRGVTHIHNIQELANALGCTIDDLVEQYDDATQREYDEFDRKDVDDDNNLIKEHCKARRETGSKLDMTVWNLLSRYDTSSLTQIAVMIAGDEQMYYKDVIPEDILPEDILDSYVENWRILTNFYCSGVTVEVPHGYALLRITLKEDK